MFSATFPANVENLAKNILKNPIEIIVGNLLYLIFFRLHLLILNITL